MASKEIKGIVIQIEGKNDGLIKSLKEVEQNLKKDEDALKRLDKALKLDPKNVDLLAAKEAVLADKTAQTSAKMQILQQVQKDALNDLPKDAELSSAQMAELTTEIANTEGELEDLKKTGSVFTNIKEGASNAKDKLEKVGEVGEKIGSGIKKGTEVAIGALGALGAAAGAATVAAVGAISSAVFNLGKQVVTQFADYEQALGGSEAVFQQYASTIQNAAKDSWKTMGTTEEQFLASANKVGALFQGTGVSAERSAELTTQAMTRAADMASVMGVDTQAALDAITGAAKGNYTMMDNLGVKMDKTTLEAYAMAKGFDKAWKDMSGAEQAEVAMQYFFENTEKYAGNFEREATETISGSIGMLKSSWSNLITQLGSGEADIEQYTQSVVTSFEAVANNILPVVENLAQNLPTMITGLISGLEPLIGPLLDSIIGILSSLLEGIAGILPEVADKFSELVVIIADTIANNQDTLMSSITQILNTLVNAIVGLLPTLIPIAIKAIETLVNALLDNIDIIIDGAVQLVMGLVNALTQNDVLSRLVTAAGAIVTKLSLALLDSKNLKTIVESVKQLLLTLVKGISTNLPTILPAVVEAFATLAMALTDPQFLSEMISALVECLVTLADTIVENLPLFIQALVAIIGNLAIALGENFPLLIETALRLVGELIFMVFETIGSLLGFNLDEIFEVFQGAFDTICGIFEGIGDWFGDRWEDIKNVFSKVGEFFSGIFETAWSMIKKPFETTASWFSELWDDIKAPFSKVGEFFEGAFKTVGDVIKAPLNAVIKGINVVIGALNSLSIDIPSWVPGIGGDTWGIDIPKVPYLARGGVLKKGQLGLLEGTGAEAVVPLENNEGWIKATASALKTQFDYSVATNTNVAQPIDYTSSFQMMADKISGLQQNGEEKNPPTFNLIVQLGQMKFAEMVAQAQADNTYYAGGY